ncbi:5-formyltetrahydrofolate cyclo-ligase [Acidipropionibacterium thoenii]|uniref:5-formyltetrahydrofolate cyclo-ligase n=1 Tax=Acidipropionibacterium thoenii TaxID=1751 RepID=UPI000425DF56|nr:5-formyltetrahydrofolate cyclo-ligase [Acidipropionibacterium thoenii]
MSSLLLPDGSPGDSKRAWRELGRRRRAGVGAQQNVVREAGWAQTGSRRILSSGVSTVALYLSRPGEPGTGQLADALVRAGLRVLAPVLTDRAGRGLHDPAWGLYSPGQTRPGLWAIPEPIGQTLPAEGLGQADLVICSALWADLEGHRVGTGGGWYDRALVWRRSEVPVWAMVDDSEVVERLPHDSWDIPVDAALTPTGLTALG